MKSYSRMSRRLPAMPRSVVLVWLLFSSLFAVVLSSTAYFAYQKEKSTVQTLVQETAYSYESLIRYLLSDLERILVQLHEDYPLQSEPDIESLEALLRHRVSTNPFIMDLLLMDAQGRLVAWSGEGTKPELSERSYFQHHLLQSGSERFVSPPELSIVHDGKWFFSLSLAQRNDSGELAGVSTALIDIAALIQLFEGVEESPTLSVALIHQEGKLLLRLPRFSDYQTGDTLPARKGVERPLLNVTVLEMTSALDGLKRMFVLRPLIEYDLLVVSSADMHATLGVWKLSSKSLLLIWLLVSGAGFMVAMLYARQKEQFTDQLRQLTQSLPGFVYQLEQSGPDQFVYRYASEGVSEMFGVSKQAVEADAQLLLNMIHPDDYPRVLAESAECTASMTPWHSEFRMSLPDGRVIWLEARDQPRRLANGHLIWTGYANDITERKELEETLHHMALHDPLTELPNRAFFFRLAEQALAIAQRNGKQLALMFVDLDNFKPINDQFGHGVGDRLLQQVAKRMELSLRASDLIGRIGGDEFVVLLPEVESRVVAYSVAEKLRMELFRPYEIDGRQHQISVSIGIAVYPMDAEQLQSLVKRADQAMYLAKQRGRNCSQLATDSVLPLKEAEKTG